MSVLLRFASVAVGLVALIIGAFVLAKVAAYGTYGHTRSNTPEMLIGGGLIVAFLVAIVVGLEVARRRLLRGASSTTHARVDAAKPSAQEHRGGPARLPPPLASHGAQAEDAVAVHDARVHEQEVEKAFVAAQSGGANPFVVRSTHGNVHRLVLPYAPIFYYFLWLAMGVTVIAMVQWSAAWAVVAFVFWTILTGLGAQMWDAVFELKKRMRGRGVSERGSKWSFTNPLTYSWVDEGEPPSK